MSRNKEIQNIIMNIMEDGELHTMEEFRKACLQKGVISPEKGGVIRGVIFKIKSENNNFITIDRGKYRLRKTDDSNENGNAAEEEFDKMIKYMKQKIDMFKKFNWILCTDKELETARKQITALAELANDIKKIVDN